MCDTLYVPAERTAQGRALFAKNSDRERNEAQALDWRPARPREGGRVRATYVSVPGGEGALACLLSRPFWGFGAEMGVNAAGVALGNEAVQSRPGLLPPSRRGGLTGMDLVRLGLERGASAAQALSVVTGLLEAHGQGGDCGHLSSFHYHNSFLIADPREAFVLETLGRDWAAERVSGPRAISNAYSIASPTAGQSPGLSALLDADAEGAPGGLAARLQDPLRARAGGADLRASRSRRRLASAKLGVADMMAALRDHGGEAAPFDPAVAKGKTVCMHAGSRGRRSQTVASMVCELDLQGGLVWVTAASAPCLSVFRPLFFGTSLDDLGPLALGPSPGDRADLSSRWWRREAAHRRALGAYKEALARFAPARDALEARMIALVDGIREAPWAERLKAQKALWAEADRLEAALLPLPEAGGAASAAAPATPYQRSWRRLSRAAGLDI